MENSTFLSHTLARIYYNETLIWDLLNFYYNEVLL
jgi:hypothetical protein